MRMLRVGFGRLACGVALSVAAASPAAAQETPGGELTLLQCTLPPTPAISDRRPVGGAGASLQTLSGHLLEVPAGAVAAERAVELAELGDGLLGVRITSGPDPVVFAGPVRLTLAYGRCSPGAPVERPVIVRLEDDGALSPLPSTHDEVRRSVTTILTGNSEYALAVPRQE